MANSEKNPINSTEHVTLLTQNDMNNLRLKFNIPAGVRLRIPSVGDLPSCPKPGEIGLYTVAFEYGLRLPFHPFIRTVLAHFDLAPTQLSPNVWRHMAGAIILWRICSEEKDHITLDEFNFCYMLRYRPKTKFWFLYPRDNRVLVLDCPKFLAKGWQERFFFARGTDWEFSPKERTLPCASLVPKEWGGFPDAEKLKEPKLSNFYRSRVKRALKFDHNYRAYKNLITPENVQKYLLDDIPVMV
ncbi:hypothetical protein L484_008713 [Morus notabilis]|uniref:Transposase (putative) gypsy type domain-containing protein n=1 Tax=Morus notabilis TaxID=981085 RepID=W9RP25_9ROSA|nr:hypothetical protein L484_008713 [Morus notabilis]